jgi:ADP-ribose pyrophosphatase
MLGLNRSGDDWSGESVPLKWTLPTDHPIQRTAEVAVYHNSFITVYDDEVSFVEHPGEDARYLRIVERDGRDGAAALATCDGLVALVLVYRYPRRQWEWGIPRGFAESDDAGVTLRIELDGELGGEPRAASALGSATPNSGLLAGSTSVFHAEYDTPVAAPKDPEVREVRWVTVPDLAEAILNGDVADSFTLSALTLAAVRGIVRLPQVTR